MYTFGTTKSTCTLFPDKIVFRECLNSLKLLVIYKYIVDSCVPYVIKLSFMIEIIKIVKFRYDHGLWEFCKTISSNQAIYLSEKKKLLNFIYYKNSDTCGAEISICSYLYASDDTRKGASLSTVPRPHTHAP